MGVRRNEKRVSVEAQDWLTVKEKKKKKKKKKQKTKTKTKR